MNTISWNNSRLLLLRLCSIVLIGTIPYIFLKPQQDAFRSLSISNQWKAINRDKISISYRLLNRKKFKEKNNHNLGLEVVFIPSHNTDLSTLIESHLELKLKPKELTIIEDKNIGSYGLFTKDNSTYLSTCIHPQGKAAFGKKEFVDLANYNLRDRIFPWVLGLADFRDWRCFWVNISVDLENITEPEATKLLQEKLTHIISQSKFK